MKQAQHTIEGIVYTLDFGRMWFSKYFGEATSTDPMQMGDLLNKPDKQFDFIVGILYAGINCHKKVTKDPNLVSLMQCQELVGSMTDSEAADLIKKYIDAQKPAESGEGQPQVVNP